jgi:hypothetical protein
MWQKLNRIDTVELEKARTQLQNAIQLVSAGPRSYLKSKNGKNDWLRWNSDVGSMESIPFGMKEKIQLSLDIEQFVLSIYGADGHIEHLVLSGITYPMAFGWLKVKLDKFLLNADQYNDEAAYTLEHRMDSDDELNVTDQKVFADIVVYFSNTYMLLQKLKEGLDLKWEISIDPATLNMVLGPIDGNSILVFGFSPGNKDYPEPYYYIELAGAGLDQAELDPDIIGTWNNKNWKGLIFSASDYLNLNPEVEFERISEFFNKNYWRLSKK